MNHYTYRVAWSPYHGHYVGTCLELPFMRREAPTAQEAIGEIETAVDRHVEIMLSTGETVPTAMADRRYSGTIVIRTSLELHSHLAVEAAEQRVSMNQWVVQKLSGRRPSDTFGLSGWD
ncbi:toxin-antitoxin system HicB family antitoxin [Mycobacterium colombiense]|uniref:Toxin-antitoxin system HicB family antitoxin n=1 Tax=Mycobacterium colombiense TaxID=339268 RepID=A0A329KNA8_9MYCO|nr:type II toxin-antitoxin system HicB family antitoxin [Mycobacterium colombiense]RAU96705.1 toxin-antitoxin system HicB family antitoxin [Mycobacterium colombiense]